MTDPDHNSITILGAGIIGLCCAISLRRKGFAVQIIDREEAGQATSFGNAGVISPWSCVPQNTPGVWKGVPKWMLDPKGPVRVRWPDLDRALPWGLSFLLRSSTENVTRVSQSMWGLTRQSIELYQSYLAGSGQESLLQSAWYVNAYRGKMVASTEDLTFRLKAYFGGDIELVGAGALHEIEPDLSPAFHSAILIKGQARANPPGKLGTALAQIAAGAGVDFIRGEVADISAPDLGQTVLTLADGRKLTAAKLVLTAGIWSRNLLQRYKLRLPLIAERGYHLEFDSPGVHLNHSVQDMAGKVILSSMPGALRIAGSSELARPDRRPNYGRADMLAEIARIAVPGLAAVDVSRRWMGNRPSFPDNLPAIGALKSNPNIIAAFGHSHYGMSMAPGTARLVTEILCNSADAAELRALAPERFSR